MRKIIHPALLALLLGACVSMFSAVAPGPVTIRDQVTVTAPAPWNRYEVRSAEYGEMWTRDGLNLDNLWFYVGIPDGEPLRQGTDLRGRKLPKFQAAMTPNEIVEMIESYYTADGSTFTLEKLTPAPFAGSTGFRFEFRKLRKYDEVELRGTGFGIVQKNRLYLILYTAPAIHYYKKYLPQVEAVAASLVIKK